MSVMQRTIIVQPEAGDEEYLFDRLSEDLKLSAATWAGLTVNDERLAGWPWVNFDDENKQVWAKAWSSEHEPPYRFLTMSLREYRDDMEWRSLIKLGALGDGDVVVFDTLDIRPLQAQLPVGQLPDVLAFLRDYVCRDSDRLETGRSLRLYKDQVRKFIQFLERVPTDRQLPVVLVSTAKTTQDYVADRHSLAQRLTGLAHVVCLNQGEAWWSYDLPLAHKCFDGAVRVYLPGYSRQDPPHVHPWWHRDKFAPDSMEQTNDEIVRFVIEKTYPRFRINRTIVELERALSKYRRTAGKQRQIDELRRQLKAEENADVEGFYPDYENMERDLADVKEENAELKQEVWRLMQVLNQQWLSGNDDDDVSTGEPRLFLSQQAFKTWQALNNHERDQLYKTLLGRLLQPDQREGQSVVRQALDGPCWISPRGNNTNGQRVVYTLENDDVYLCEIFRVHADYDKAWDNGISLANYQDFTELVVSS